MSILLQALRTLGRKTAEIALSNTCLLCGGQGKSVVCDRCSADLPYSRPECCRQCGAPLAGTGVCGHCLKEPPYFDHTVALYRYEFPIDSLVHSFKYGAQLSLADFFAQGLSKELRGHAYDLLIPMPLHPARLAERGFNQSAEIARTLARLLQIPLDLNGTYRSRMTQCQAELPLQKRHSNVRGAFECSADYSARRILVVDDVMTTGSTLNECARVLKLHGACEVGVAVVARAIRS